MIPHSLLRPAFFLLWALWSLLVGWYAVDDNQLASPAQALGPWLAGTIALGALFLLVAALIKVLQEMRVGARGITPVRVAGSPVLPLPATGLAAAATAPVLQIRACHARLARQAPDAVVALLDNPQATRPVLAAHADDPAARLAERGMAMQVQLALGMEMLVAALPDAAPVAMFTLAPTLTRHSRYAAMEWPGLMASQSDAPGALLLRELDVNGPSLAPVLQALFARFTASPRLCNAVLLSLEGRLIRGRYHRPRDDAPEDALDQSMVLMWITRTGVPDAIRREAVEPDTPAAQHARQPYAWFREELAAYTALAPHEPEAQVHAAAFITSLLPVLREEGTAQAQRLGDDAWYPVPWTRQQIALQEAAPVLGTLYPPRCVALRDEDGEALSQRAQAAAIAAAWQALHATLPEAARPRCVWYDGRADVDAAIALRMAMRGLADPLDLDDPRVGIDLATRVGALGGGSGAAALALALASGKAGMAVIADDDGNLLLQPIVPAPQPEATDTASAPSPHPDLERS